MQDRQKKTACCNETIDWNQDTSVLSFQPVREALRYSWLLKIKQSN